MLKKAVIIKSIVLVIGIISLTVYVSSSLISKDENLLYNNFMSNSINVQALLNNKEDFDLNNKEDFDNYCKKNLDIDVSSTNNEITELRTKALESHLYNIRDYLSKLEVTYRQIDRNEMLQIATEKNIDNFSGLYERSTNEILIVGGDTDTSVHETGHAIYYQLLGNLDKLIINSLYVKESKNLSDNYGQKSKEEFFSVAFTEFIYSPDTLKENCPATYRYFKHLDNEIKKIS